MRVELEVVELFVDDGFGDLLLLSLSHLSSHRQCAWFVKSWPLSKRVRRGGEGGEGGEEGERRGRGGGEEGERRERDGGKQNSM